MLSLSAHLTSASRICVKALPALQTTSGIHPVEISIMLEVISGTTLPGSENPRHQAQHFL
jgi:hypothetical protein